MGLQFFPFPHIVDGQAFDGSIQVWPEDCRRCPHRNCEEAGVGAPGLCSFGLNFRRVDSSMLIAGIVIEGFNPTSPARKKQLRRKHAVSLRDLNAAVDAYLAADDDAKKVRERALSMQRDELLDKEQFRVDYLSNLKQEILTGLSFFHDYKQINQQIIQNVNVVIEQRYVGESFEEKLNAADHHERAIYEAARFLDEKLNAATFLLRPEWLEVPSKCRKFRVHGVVTKYVRIYQSRFEARSMTVRILGNSYGEVVGNPSACSVIPHTFIDNAWKYAPDGSQVDLYMDDNEDGSVHLEVSSFGPKLEEGEAKAIFRPFTRGQGAVAKVEEGAGYGLYISQLIARRHLGSEITVQQDLDKTWRDGESVWTTFALTFPRLARVAHDE
jgi:signal transduction histidine kinase